MKYLPIILCAILAAPALRASDIYYDSSIALSLSTSEQSMFGVQSGRFKYDPRMIRAAQIAAARAEPRSTMRCWHYVKDALVASGVITERPSSAYAKEAGSELCQKFGFTMLSLRDPWEAPVGAVIVYGGSDAGHVELRTHLGFASDFFSFTPYRRPLIGIFVKSV